MSVMIIPAAGSGTRLNYNGPKLLFELNERPLLDYLFERYSEFIDQFVVIIHPNFEDVVKEYLKQVQVNCTIGFQYEPTGMLDAIVAPMSQLDANKVKQVWITWCDQVSITKETAQNMSQLLEQTEPSCMVFPTIKKRLPYIHMQRDDQNNIVQVLQQREGDDMPEIGENDCGLFAMSGDTYFSLLNEFSKIDQKSGSTTQERNFLPFIAWLNGKANVQTFPAYNEIEAIGINTIEDAERILNNWQSK